RSSCCGCSRSSVTSSSVSGRPRTGRSDVPAERLHLVRHGEVHNPQRLLYGRLPHYRLSEDGRRMARDAAEYIAELERPVGALRCSPLERAQESAEPFAEIFDLEP